MHRLPLFIVLLFGASAATAADWRLFSSSVHGSKFYYDVDSLRRYDGTTALGDEVYEVWTKTDHSRDKTTGERESKDLLVVNCKERTWKLKYATSLYPSGRLVKHDLSLIKFEPVVPESNVSALYEILCPDWERVAREVANMP